MLKEKDSVCTTAVAITFAHRQRLSSLKLPEPSRVTFLVSLRVAAFDAAHLGHFGGAGLLAAERTCPIRVVPAGPAFVQMAESSRVKQQHETPPKTWLVATASSKMSLRGIEYMEQLETNRIFELGDLLDAAKQPGLHAKKSIFGLSIGPDFSPMVKKGG